MLLAVAIPSNFIIFPLFRLELCIIEIIDVIPSPFSREFLLCVRSHPSFAKFFVLDILDVEYTSRLARDIRAEYSVRYRGKIVTIFHAIFYQFYHLPLFASLGQADSRIKDIYILNDYYFSPLSSFLLLCKSFYTNNIIKKFYNKQVLTINQRYNIEIRFF